MFKHLSNPFYLDLRSLALSRICLGICLFINLVISSLSLNAFYTDNGILPRAILALKYKEYSYFSLNVLSGSYSFQVLIFALTIVFSIALILGAYSRISNFLCWLFFLSIYNRNPFVLDGGDDALKLFLFWLCFLPVSKYFSLDSLSNKKNKGNVNPSNIKISGVTCFAFITQLASIYFFSAMLKTSPHWNDTGTAIHLALALDSFSSELGNYLLNFPKLLKFSTLATWNIEKYFPFLLFIPFATKFFRTIVVFTFMSFHIGLATFMDLGIFPLVMFSAWVALIPSNIWKYINYKKFINTKLNFFNFIPTSFTHRKNRSLKASF